MQLGLALPVREHGRDPAVLVDLARLAERLGLDYLRVTDGSIIDDSPGSVEPLTLLSHLAAHTRRIGLVTCILVAPLRETRLLAKQSHDLQRLSGNRLRLGIGVGGNRAAYAAAGVDFNRRGRRCDDQVGRLPELWSAMRRSAAVAGAPPVAPIPLWIGGRRQPSDPVIDRIARAADGWFATCGPDELPELRSRLEAALTRHGRRLDDLGTEVSVTLGDPERADWRQRAAAWIALDVTHLTLRVPQARDPESVETLLLEALPRLRG